MLLSGPFVPTHLVPESGMRAWAQPDGTGPAVARLDPGLDVQMLDRKGDWANIACANGWTAWVDGRLLTAWSAPPPRSRLVTGIELRGLSIVSLIGGVAIVVGSLLHWWSVGGIGTTAWDLPIAFVLGGDTGDGFKIGPVLVVAALVLVIPLLTGRKLPSFVLLAVALVALGLGGAALIRGLRESPSLYPDVGLILTMAGGALVASDGLALWPSRSS